MFNKIKNWLFHEDLKKQNLAAFVMLVGSGLGLLASFVLSIEALELAKNSHAVLSCDFSSALSCSAVANHWSVAIWMFYMSYVEIGVLCPWCLTLDLGMLMIMFGLTRYNVLQKNISCRCAQKIVGGGYDVLVMVSLVVAVIVAIIAKFGSQLF